MKINIDMENLSEMIEAAVTKNTETALNAAINEMVMAWIKDNYSDAINEIVNQKAMEYVDKYLDEVKITIGGGLSDEDIKTVSLESYVKSRFSEIIKEQVLTVKTKSDYYGREHTETISFKEYIDERLDVSDLVKKELDPFLKKTRDDINRKVKDTFDSSAKSMLSEAVYNVLMCNDTYKKMQDNIALIASKE